MRHSVGRKKNLFLFTFTCRSNSNQAYKPRFSVLWREEVRIRSLSNMNIAVFRIRALNQPFKLFPKFSARHTFTDQG